MEEFIYETSMVRVTGDTLPNWNYIRRVMVYGFLRILGKHESAENMRYAMSRFTISGGIMHRHVHEGLVVKHKSYYAFWSYKVFSSERFDLLGNSLAILSGIASPTRVDNIVSLIFQIKTFET